MRKIFKITRTVLFILVGLPLTIAIISFIIGACLYYTSDFMQPQANVDLNKYCLTTDCDSLKTCNGNYMKLNRHGLWEAYISGSPLERGAVYGVMSRGLLKYQEDVFVEQINEIIPSDSWVEFLHKLIIIFNGDMAKHIPAEYREEIYAMSLSCTNEHNAYGSPYVRQLNYHAAHDIGHAMQEYMLVGCTSFACWGNDSNDGNLIIGRNFDFYVGDNFAKNKIILFVEPSEGHRFASISWPGMMGVLSGMNEKGLTVTINAAKGAIPTSSAMPISLLARQILQYASNIDEAYDIAKQYKTFVSESLLIGSAIDGKAAIIEKTPENIALFESNENRILCTNHYQSETFSNDEYNIENIATSDSPYRHERLSELISEHSPVSADDAVRILRNRYGKENTDIGLSNEKSINQFIAHHSVVFQPEELRFWVSTSPWQLGEYICYDLDSIFGGATQSVTINALKEHNIEADSIALSTDYKVVCRHRMMYKEISTAIDEGQQLSKEFINEFVNNNPNYFQVYNILGDYELSRNNQREAVTYWQKALSMEIPRTNEKEDIINKITKYD
ncbi:MAG: choloylglycine hydrolase [Bacteroidaceae bacterium]|nr:choloylglycine hydrolase [Bacteroidaceae bacterium]